MGVPTSEVGYTTAMPRREDHEVHKDMWWHWIKKKYIAANNTDYIYVVCVIYHPNVECIFSTQFSIPP
jgi:hypothetical protein